MIKDIGMLIKEELFSTLHRAKLSKKYPQSIFHRGSYVDSRSTLGKYNVIFSNARVYNSDIGDHTFIQRGSIINNADVGKFCSIAPMVSVGLGQHPIDYVSTYPAFYSENQPLAKTFCDGEKFSPFKRVSIGHDVWIGQNAMIMDGVRIHTGAIVAAGAVVTKDVQAYAVVGGVPAKLIRFRFDESVLKALLESKWWDRSDLWLQKHYILFCDVNRFLQYIKETENI
jgi:acetyltransferase-like isoleucine patch superfamily enzyme